MATALPPDFFVKQQQFVPTIYRDQYPSIDPSSPRLSQAGKTVVITGATQGIGQGIAIGYAKAKASTIVLVGRTIAKLQQTEDYIKKISPATTVLTVPTDVTDETSVRKLESILSEEAKGADILVNVAGSWEGEGPIVQTEPEKWWKDFEVNVKGTYLVTRAFLRTVSSGAASHVINVSSFAGISPSPPPNTSSYGMSKMAMNRFTHCLAVENPQVTAIAYHPGIIETSMTDEHPGFRHFSEDTPELAAGVAVYLTTPEAKFLNGRYISANWSVDELEKKKDEIVEKDLLRLRLQGEFGSHLF